MPEFELREVAAAVHVSWADFQHFPLEEKVTAVAQIRMRSLLEMHSNDAMNRDITRRQRMAG